MGEEEVYELSPFEVDASGDIGYAARETLAGTRLRTDLRDVPNAVSVVNEKFLQDTGAVDSEDLLVYTTNTEVGGIQGNYAGTGDGSTVRESDRVAPQNNTRVRGFDEANNTRSFYLTDIPWDGYNVDRVDLQRGANAILFGNGSAAGIINTSLKQAQFFNRGEAEFRFGEHGTHRVSGDYNLEILDKELAARIVGLYEHEYFQQDPAFERDKRIYGALRYDPSFLHFENARTSLRVNYENGSIVANRPRIIPPIDRISPWFNALDQRVYDPRTITATDYEDWVALGCPATYGAATLAPFELDDGTTVPNPNFEPWMFGKGGYFADGPLYIYPDHESGTPSLIIPSQLQFANDGESVGGYEPWNGPVTFEEYAKRAKLPGSNIGAYKETHITDTSIFDYYDKLIDGPNKREWDDFEAYNITLTQTFFEDRVGFEVARDYQEDERSQVQRIDEGGNMITVDVMAFYPNGQPNPNVGRAMVASVGGSSDMRYSKWETNRATAFGELRFSDFMDEESDLTKFLGRHVFTGLYNDSDNYVERRAWETASAADSYWPGSSSAIDQANRQIATLSYLGGPLFGKNLRGLELPRIESKRIPMDGNILLFDRTVANPDIEPGEQARYVGWRPVPFDAWSVDSGDRENLVTQGGTDKNLDEVESWAFIWQGYLWNEKIVPLVGWRRDEAINATSGGGLPGDPEWYVPDSADDADGGNRRYAKEDKDTTTWGIVVHSPDFIERNLPYGMRFSVFYGESSNFVPRPGRVDPLGAPLAAQSGETKEYGFTVSALEDRVILKVNWYESKVFNATLTGGLPGDYLLGMGEAWAYMFATRAKLAYDTGMPAPTFDKNYNEGGSFFLPYQPLPGQTVEQARDYMLAAVNGFLANPPPESLQRAWGFDTDEWAKNPADWINVTYLSGMAVTADTESEGVEFELAAQPMPNWNVTFNASKTEATRLNIGKSLADWVEERYAFYQTPAGNVRFWYHTADNETIRTKFENEFYGNYLLQRQLEGADVAELRPWRFNLVTNYTFTEGLLKGFNVGGGYRWQDKIVLGYGVKNIGTTADPIYRYDVDKKYYGSAESDIDLWVGYERDLTERVRWRVQLNVRNAFDGNELIPIAVQPDGSPAGYRIKEGMSWFISNTFIF